MEQVSVTPTQLNYTLPRNYQQTLSVIKATTGEGTTATHLRLIYDAANQSGGQLPRGLDVTLGAPVNLTANQSAVLPITLSGDNSAVRVCWCSPWSVTSTRRWPPSPSTCA